MQCLQLVVTKSEKAHELVIAVVVVVAVVYSPVVKPT